MTGFKPKRSFAEPTKRPAKATDTLLALLRRIKAWLPMIRLEMCGSRGSAEDR